MQARIEGEERVIGDVASPSPSLVSLTLRGYFYGKGGARLISCPEFRTSGNLHPWVHINVEEEQQRREMEKWRGSLEGVAEQRPWKREREGGAQNREFRAPFFDATRSSGYGSSFSSALFCFFRRRGGSKTLFNSGVAAGDRLSLSGFWFTRTADAAARFYRVQGVERDPITVLYLYVRCRRRRTAEEEADTGKGRLISWTLDGKMGEE